MKNMMCACVIVVSISLWGGNGGSSLSKSQKFNKSLRELDARPSSCSSSSPRGPVFSEPIAVPKRRSSKARLGRKSSSKSMNSRENCIALCGSPTQDMMERIASEMNLSLSGYVAPTGASLSEESTSPWEGVSEEMFMPTPKEKSQPQEVDLSALSQAIKTLKFSFDTTLQKEDLPNIIEKYQHVLTNLAQATKSNRDDHYDLLCEAVFVFCFEMSSTLQIQELYETRVQIEDVKISVLRKFNTPIEQEHAQLTKAFDLFDGAVLESLRTNDKNQRVVLYEELWQQFIRDEAKFTDAVDEF